MKYIVIYAYNEEIADLKDYAQRLVKKGARVIFHNLAHFELFPKADTVLTFARYLPRVVEWYAGTSINVSALDADTIAPEVPAVEEAGLVIELPVEEVVVTEVPAELPAEELAEVEALVAETEEVTMVVAADPTPAKRGRSSK